MGDLDPDWADEYPIWRCVMANKGVSLADIEYWSLERMEQFNAYLDMEEDHQNALRMYLTPEPKEKEDYSGGYDR